MKSTASPRLTSGGGFNRRSASTGFHQRGYVAARAGAEQMDEERGTGLGRLPPAQENRSGQAQGAGAGGELVCRGWMEQARHVG